MMRTFRYRLYPTPSQTETLTQFVGVVRLVYNLALEQRRDWSRRFKANVGKSISLQSQSTELSELRKTFDWIAAVPRCAQEQALWDLDEAFQRFFSKKSGYPSHRHKGQNDSFRIPGKDIYSPIRAGQNLRYAEIKIPKVGWCKFRLSRNLPDNYTLAEATIACDSVGWHICLSLRWLEHPVSARSGVIGIDRGVANTLAFSDGSFASQPISHLRGLARRARAHQMQLSRQNRYSKRRAVTRRLLSKAQAKIARVRKHWNHERSTALAGVFQKVVMEALQTSAMTRTAAGTLESPGVRVRQKAGLNRSILEHGWHQFERLLAYKLEAAGGQLIKVNPAYTSQTCSSCGSISKTHRKSQAVFECSECGHTAHADTNAALNILRAGEQPASRGAVRPSMKRELSGLRAEMDFNLTPAPISDVHDGEKREVVASRTTLQKDEPHG